MNKQLKQQILVVAFGVTLFAVLMNLNDVAGFFRTFTGIFSPVFQDCCWRSYSASRSLALHGGSQASFQG